VIGCFYDIAGIVDCHCLNIPFFICTKDHGYNVDVLVSMDINK